jgi:hypothetical protein
VAKATATCTCATCGTTFTRAKICRNRREADGWEAWAAANFDECDACYTARKASERKASEREAAAVAEAELPLTLHMTGYPDRHNTPVVLFFGGDTVSHKDDIKSLGYRWVFADDYITYGYSVQRGERKWIKVVPQEDAYDEIERVKALGAVIDDSIVDTEYLAKQAAAKRERVAAAEASGITEPVKPVCYPAGRWNGKVYGAAAYGYRIYVGNAEVQISGDDADALKRYAKALAAWREATAAKETSP